MAHHNQQLSIDIQEWQKPIEKLWEIDLDELSSEIHELTTKTDQDTNIATYKNHTLLRSFLIIYEHSKNISDYEHPFEYRAQLSKHLTSICSSIITNTFVSLISFAILTKDRIHMVFYNLSNLEKIRKKVNKEFSRKDLTSADFITNLTGLSKAASKFFENFTHKTFSKELILIKPNGTIEEVSELPNIQSEFEENFIIFKIMDVNTYNMNTKLLMDNFKGGKYSSIKSSKEILSNAIVEFIDNRGVEQNTDRRRWVKFASKTKSLTKAQGVCVCCLKERSNSVSCGNCKSLVCENSSFCRICDSILIDFNNIIGLERIFKRKTVSEYRTERLASCAGCCCKIKPNEKTGICSKCKGIYCEDCNALIVKYNMSCNKCST